MKKVLLVCAFIVSVSTLSFAQGGGGRMRMKPEEQVAALKTSLTLTDDQSAKVLSILTASAKVTDSIRTAANGDFQAARPAMTKARAAADAKILTVLTADQATAYKKQLEERAKAQAARQAGN
jgi:protein CpxP